MHSRAGRPSGAMGGGQSSDTNVGGFRVFKVTMGSPAFEAGLEVFFDFIVEINGCPMDSNQQTFYTKIQEAENVRTKMIVHNIRTRTSRDVFITPRKWGGVGLLGAVVRYDALDNADSQGMRVLDVFPNSPAEMAGLLPLKDYLLGTADVMFRDLDELGEIISLCLGKAVKVHVYNSDTESIREVALVPRTDWGGEGCIGADIRAGLLHRIPAPRRFYNFSEQVPTIPPPSPATAPRAPLPLEGAMPPFPPPDASTEPAAASSAAWKQVDGSPQARLEKKPPCAAAEVGQEIVVVEGAAPAAMAAPAVENADADQTTPQPASSFGRPRPKLGAAPVEEKRPAAPAGRRMAQALEMAEAHEEAMAEEPALHQLTPPSALPEALSRMLVAEGLGDALEGAAQVLAEKTPDGRSALAAEVNREMQFMPEDAEEASPPEEGDAAERPQELQEPAPPELAPPEAPAQADLDADAQQEPQAKAQPPESSPRPSCPSQMDELLAPGFLHELTPGVIFEVLPPQAVRAY